MIPLPSPPQDLISSVRFAPENTILITTSWDSVLRIYDVRNAPAFYGSLSFGNALLDSAWDLTHGNRLAYVAGFDKTVYAIDVENGGVFSIGREHSEAIKSLTYHRGTRSLIAGSFDKTLQQIDTRAASHEKSPLINLPGKVYAMDCTEDDNLLVVAMSGLKVNTYDLRNLNKPLKERDTPFSYPARTVRCLTNGKKGYATTSLDGRVGVSYFDEADQATEFVFKCHRIADASGSPDAPVKVVPVNALAIHPTLNNFYTGGSDHKIMAWDYQTKRRKKMQGEEMPGSVMALDIDRSTGSKLAIGVSDDGFREDPALFGPRRAQSSVFIRYLSDLGL